MFILVIFGISAVGLSAACGSDDDDVAYAPSAYGVPGQCYYVHNPAEAIELRNAGLCPAGWVPTLAPPLWLYTYAAFYTSPAYVNVYVPNQYRTVYRNTYSETWRTKHQAYIDRESRNAKWKGTDGKAYSGQQVYKKTKSGKASFQGGNVRSEGFPSGETKKPLKSKNQPPANQQNQQNQNNRPGNQQNHQNNRPGNQQNQQNKHGSGTKSKPKGNSGYNKGGKGYSGGSRSGSGGRR